MLATLPSLALQQPKLQASSRGPIAGAKQDHWTPPQSQPGRVRPLSVEASAAERQELALRSLSEAAADPRFGARFCGKLVRESCYRACVPLALLLQQHLPCIAHATAGMCGL